MSLLVAAGVSTADITVAPDVGNVIAVAGTGTFASRAQDSSGVGGAATVAVAGIIAISTIVDATIDLAFAGMFIVSSALFVLPRPLDARFGRGSETIALRSRVFKRHSVSAAERCRLEP
jgi:hypothetical protein